MNGIIRLDRLTIFVAESLPSLAGATGHILASFATFHCQPSPFPTLSIESKPHDQPAAIGSLQVGDAANSRRFRAALFPGVESRRQTGHRTSCRTPRRFPGSAMGA